MHTGHAGFNLVAALISYPAGSLSDRWGRKGVLLLSFIIFSIAYLGFARTKNVVLIATLFVFYGLFQGNIPFGRQGICFGFGAGAPEGQWS
jgi:MFS family permease